MKKVVVVLSGGMDSAVLLHHFVKGGDEVRALSINYGQRHKIELTYALQTADSLGVPIQCAHLSNLAALLPGSSQTERAVPVPHGHYEQESMKLTVVPNRNMILMAVAIGHAIAYQCDSVAYGAHAGDHAIYPDCRPEFADAMENVTALCDWNPPKILRPFIKMTKAEIVKLGDELGVNFALTFSCYEGRSNGIHCGRCGTCVERAAAFAEAGVKDPTRYIDKDYFKTITGHATRK